MKMEKVTFNHSVKVPKLYKCAAQISQKVAGGASSIKQLVYEKTHFNTKALYALVVTTFQKANELDLLLKRTKLLEKENRLDPWLAKILISELLWGKKQLPKSEAKPILTILAYEQAFHAHLSDSSRDSFPAKSLVHRKPRYIRVNTLINSVNEALELFQEEGWVLLSPDNQKIYTRFLEQVSSLDQHFFLRDIHIPDILIFPSGTEFYSHPGYKKGAIILQDKASCLPVHILSPPPGSVVLDMCAAPGMKATQLAAILQDNGTIYAVERDSKRVKILKKIVETSGATCIEIVNRDVLLCNADDFPNVEYILVDPSCSGSGMTDRFELNSSRNTYRLQKLAGFQIKILRSALTRYPNVKKVVYSTCSLNPEENEDVVRQVLETNNEFKLVPADTFMNKAWVNFGSSDFGNIGKYCLYARPDEDLTNGFFLAVFERLEEGENNEFYNGRVLNYRKNIDQKQARKHKKNWNNKDVDISKDSNENAENSMEIDTSSTRIIKTKKHKREGLDNKFVENNVTDYIHEDIRIGKPKRKKTKQKTESSDISEELDSKNVVQDNLEAHVARKKKKREQTEELSMIANDSPNLFREVKSSKKSKKKKHTLENVREDDGCEQRIIKYDLTNETNENNCVDKQKSHKTKQTKVVKELT